MHARRGRRPRPSPASPAGSRATWLASTTSTRPAWTTWPRRLRQDPRSRVIVVGHADNGERFPEVHRPQRAEAVKDYLVKERGIEESRITTRSAAATKPARHRHRRRRPRPQPPRRGDLRAGGRDRARDGLTTSINWDAVRARPQGRAPFISRNRLHRAGLGMPSLNSYTWVPGRVHEATRVRAFAGTPRAALLLLSSSCRPRSAQSWVPVGPPGGDVRSLAADPRDPRRIYLGTVRRDALPVRRQRPALAADELRASPSAA